MPDLKAKGVGYCADYCGTMVLVVSDNHDTGSLSVGSGSIGNCVIVGWCVI